MKNFKRTLLWSVVLYALLTVLRLAYVMVTNSDMTQSVNYYAGAMNAAYINEDVQAQSQAKFSSESVYLTKNIARVKVQQDTAGKIWALEQAYEKVGTLSSTSYNFEKDETDLRKSIGEFKAITQREQLAGLKGSRSVMMTIGVPPDSFDAFIDKIKMIGKINSFTVVKTDRTGDYRELQSKKAALVEARNSLMQLKKREGKIEELMNLETRIYEIGKEIQSLSAGINIFEAGKDYCTINFTLAESGRKITTIARLIDAMEWAFWRAIWICVFLILAMIALMAVLKVISYGQEYREFKLYKDSKASDQEKQPDRTKKKS